MDTFWKQNPKFHPFSAPVSRIPLNPGSVLRLLSMYHSLFVPSCWHESQRPGVYPSQSIRQSKGMTIFLMKPYANPCFFLFMCMSGDKCFFAAELSQPQFCVYIHFFTRKILFQTCFFCTIPFESHSGNRCEAVINRCHFNLCQNNAVCQRFQTGGYKCICHTGFTGESQLLSIWK